MSDSLDLQTPKDLTGILKQISAVATAGAKSAVLDAVQQMVPTLMFSAAASLLTASGVSLPPCDLEPPPKDIFMTIDARTKGLRLECKHTPPHCWDLDGNATSC